MAYIIHRVPSSAVSSHQKGDQKEICKIILAKGDLQVSDKERQAQQDAMFKGTDRQVQVRILQHA